MMNDKKKNSVLPQEMIEELSDTQLSQVNGGLQTPVITGNENPGKGSRKGPGFGSALEKPSTFTKSDDQVP